MSLIFMEGFDWVDPALSGLALGNQIKTYWFDANTSTFSPFGIVSSGRLGAGNAIQLGGQSSSQWLASPLLSAIPIATETVLGFAVNPSGVNNSSTLLQIRSGTTHALTLRTDGVGSLLVYENNTFRENTGVILPLNQWTYLETKFTLGTSGSVEIRLNGKTEWSNNNIDIDAGVTSWNNFVLYAPNPFNGNTQYDDIYLLDTTGVTNNDFLGSVNVKTLVPDAAGGTNTFTASDASPAADHWLMVNELPNDGDATYLEGSTSGEREMFSYEPSNPLGAVYAVQHLVAARVTDNTSRDIRFTTQFGASVNDNGVETVASSTYKFSSITYDLNPDNSSIWTEAAIDATDFGITID